MNISHQTYDAAKSRNGGITRRQFEVLGVDWPPQKGWRRGNYTAEQVAEFVRLKDAPRIYAKQRWNMNNPATLPLIFDQNPEKPPLRSIMGLSSEKPKPRIQPDHFCNLPINPDKPDGFSLESPQNAERGESDLLEGETLSLR